MPERLVDVLNGAGNVLHTFPVVVDASDAISDEDYITNALKLAAHSPLIPGGDVKAFTARLHIARGGPLAPYGDDRHVLEGTMQGLENVLRMRAYYIWQQDGQPHGHAEEHRYFAFDQHLRERAVLPLAPGKLPGRTSRRTLARKPRI